MTDVRLHFLYFCVLFLIGYTSAVMMKTDFYKETVFIPEKDKALIGYEIAKHRVTSPIDCSFLCKMTDKCQSYEYDSDGFVTVAACKLNNATKHNVLQYINSPGNMHYEPQVARSCLDILRVGASKNGIYTITDTSGDSYQVFCDLTSEPRSAWTLVMSFAFKNKDNTNFKSKPLTVNADVNQNTPNWEAYRLSLERMTRLSNVSSHGRYTTMYKKYGVDFIDYMRFKLTDLNILTYNGVGECKTIEYVNVRENIGEGVTVQAYQNSVTIYHIDSSQNVCGLDATSESVVSEDNFGTYNSFNKKFRGSMNLESTTELWLGGYL